MSSNQSIKELMSAESQASKIISEARQERGERLKQAKIEADAEIAEFRKQQEQAFQMNGNADLMSDDASILEAETAKEIETMKSDFETNKPEVIKMMVKHALNVKVKVPEARLSKA